MEDGIVCGAVNSKGAEGTDNNLKIMNEVTNGLAGMQGAAGQVVSAFNAWNVVALGVGAALTHGYHLVVAAGGVKRIWLNFWDGPGGRTAAGEPPSADQAVKRGPGN